MHFSYATKYTVIILVLVMDETNNYPLWEHIQKITWFHLRNKIFPSLIPVNSHVKPTNNNAVLK